MKVVTHGKAFHADDVCAAAVLYLLGLVSSLFRTRNRMKVESADIAIDVGYVYNPERNRYDHHQEGGAGIRPNGIPYASFGLVWKHWGEQLCGSAEVAELVDAHLVQSVDATDCGHDLYANLTYQGAAPHTVSDIIWAYNPDWDKNPTGEDFDRQFMLAVEVAKEMIYNAIRQAVGCIKAKEIVLQSLAVADDPQILVLDCFCPRRDWQVAVIELESVRFVLFPSEAGQWSIQAVPVGRGFSAVKRRLPASWLGKRDWELRQLTGVDDAIFCHNAGFVAVAHSKEGALKMAHLALADD